MTKMAILQNGLWVFSNQNNQMYFYLNSSFQGINHHKLVFGEHEHQIIALEKLANAYRAGTHIISASRETFDSIINCSGLSTPSRGIYTKLRNQSTQNNLAREHLWFLFEVSTESIPIYANKKDGSSTIYINTSHIANSSITEKR